MDIVEIIFLLNVPLLMCVRRENQGAVSGTGARCLGENIFISAGCVTVVWDMPHIFVDT